MSERKIFFLIFSSFLNTKLNFEHILKKDGPDRFCISETTDSENVVI